MREVGAWTNHEAPFDHGEERALEDVELGDGDAADARVEGVRAEGVAEALARDGDRGDEEAVAREGGEREERDARADLVDVEERDEEHGFLDAGQRARGRWRADGTSTLVNRTIRLR